MLDLGGEFGPAGHRPDDANDGQVGYPLALGVGITAGVIQILFGLFKAGKLGELVPLTPVHGMLAAIGITIMAKQFFPMLGLTAPPAGPPIDAIVAIPDGAPAREPDDHRHRADQPGHPDRLPVPQEPRRVPEADPGAGGRAGRRHPAGLCSRSRRMGTTWRPDEVPGERPGRDPACRPGDRRSSFPDFRGVATATGIKYVDPVRPDRQHRVDAQFAGDRHDRPVAAEDRPEPRPAGRRRGEHAVRGGRAPCR